MTDTSGKDETVVTDDSKTTVTAPVVSATEQPQENAELVAAKKAAEQATMRANQLENENKKLKEADEEATRKRLAENEEWKSLAEQEQAKREALEAEKEADTKAKQLKEATAEIFSKFPDEVVELAEEAGLGLAELTDEDKTKLEAKLTKFAEKIPTKKVSANNSAGTTSNATPEELMERMRSGDKNARAEIISNLPGVQEMRKLAGYETE